MTTLMTTPKSVTELVKVTARLGKRAVLFSGVDPASDRLPTGKVAVDISSVGALLEFSRPKQGCHRNWCQPGRLARETVGENGLIRQASLLIANPLVRNRITCCMLSIRTPSTLIFRRRLLFWIPRCGYRAQRRRGPFR
jgi:hypothetical protein